MARYGQPGALSPYYSRHTRTRCLECRCLSGLRASLGGLHVIKRHSDDDSPGDATSDGDADRTLTSLCSQSRPTPPPPRPGSADFSRCHTGSCEPTAPFAPFFRGREYLSKQEAPPTHHGLAAQSSQHEGITPMLLQSWVLRTVLPQPLTSKLPTQIVM